jgi:PAS domain S-box-containing protein
MKTLKEIKEETSLPAIMTDHQGFIIYANDAFRVVFGWTEAEIVGQTLEVVIPSTFHDSHHLGFSRFAMTEQPTVLNHPLQLKAVRYDRSEIEAEHFITAEKQEGKWFFGAILRPLSE